MKAVIGVRIPRGQDGAPLAGMARDVVRNVLPEEATELVQREYDILDEIAKILAPAFAEHMREYREGRGVGA